MKGILSGNAEQITQLLSPQISAEKKGVQQDQKTNAMMGTRSGGTAASNVASSDKVHSDITNLVGSLTGGAASGLTSVGSNLLGQGMSGAQAGFGEATQMQQQRAAQINDIFKSSAAVAGSVVGGIGNLDTTGGSTWQEQMKNFMSGANQ